MWFKTLSTYRWIWDEKWIRREIRLRRWPSSTDDKRQPGRGRPLSCCRKSARLSRLRQPAESSPILPPATRISDDVKTGYVWRWTVWITVGFVNHCYVSRAALQKYCPIATVAYVATPCFREQHAGWAIIGSLVFWEVASHWLDVNVEEGIYPIL